jgi:hypothetical protein
MNPIPVQFLVATENGLSCLDLRFRKLRSAAIKTCAQGRSIGSQAVRSELVFVSKLRPGSAGALGLRILPTGVVSKSNHCGNFIYHSAFYLHSPTTRIWMRKHFVWPSVFEILWIRIRTEFSCTFTSVCTLPRLNFGSRQLLVRPRSLSNVAPRTYWANKSVRFAFRHSFSDGLHTFSSDLFFRTRKPKRLVWKVQSSTQSSVSRFFFSFFL